MNTTSNDSSKSAESINEFDFSLICEYFSTIDRQGPGSVEATLKALSFIGSLLPATQRPFSNTLQSAPRGTHRNCLTPDSQIADLGCGTGGQTLTLALNTPGHITAIDLFPEFIERLGFRIATYNRHGSRLIHDLNKRITGIVGSMDNLPFAEESLDLIWCEGAIYNIGFQRGFKEWRKFLKPNGYIAVTEASWFTDERPEEIERFWTDAYPEIDTIPHKVAQIQDAGYIPVACFALPESCWTENFYLPQVKAQKQFLKAHQPPEFNATSAELADFERASELVAYMRHEADFYAKYKSYYGYVFYIAQRRG